MDICQNAPAYSHQNTGKADFKNCYAIRSDGKVIYGDSSDTSQSGEIRAQLIGDTSLPAHPRSWTWDSSDISGSIIPEFQSAPFNPNAYTSATSTPELLVGFSWLSVKKIHLNYTDEFNNDIGNIY